MKRHLSILFFSSLSAWAQTPDWAWYREMRGSGIEEARDVAVDASGNIYVAGSFNSPALALGSVTLTNGGGSGTSEVFVAKYNRTGALQWAKAGTGSGEDYGISVALDASGNVFVTGWFQSPTLTFGATSVTNFTNTATEDMFVAKFSAAGTVLWARAYGGTQPEYAYSIAADGSGNCFITGEFYSLSVVFGSYGVINAGASDGFITKLDAAGNALWAKRLGGGNIDYARDVSVDGSGNALVVGSFNSTSMNSFSPALANAGGFDAYYAKYDGNGNNTLAGKFGGNNDEHAYAVTCLSTGEYFIMGTFLGSSVQLGSISLSNATGGDIFYAKLSASGSPVWAVRSSGSQTILRGDLAVDGSGNLYATGSHNLSSFGSGSVNITTGGGFDGFVLKFSGSNGSALWGRGTGSPGAEEFTGIDVTGGYVHTAGYFGGTLTIASSTDTPQGGTDGLLAKMCIAPAGPVSTTGATVCPRTGTVLTGVTPPGTTPVWFAAASGGTPLATGNSFSTATAGTYYVAAKDTNAGCAILSVTRIPAVLANYPGANPVVTLTGHTLNAAGQGSIIGWLNCATGSTISGQTANSYVLSGSGVFAVIMNFNGCRDTSVCNSYSYTPGHDTVIVLTGIDQHAVRRINVFPNPASGAISITGASGRYHVIDGAGKSILTVWVGPGETAHLPAGVLPAGIYVIASDDRRSIARIVVMGAPE